MAIVKKRLNTSDYNLCNTDVYVEYDDELYNITLYSKNGKKNIVVLDVNESVLEIFDAHTTGFIIFHKDNIEPFWFVSSYDVEKKKYYLQLYYSDLFMGALDPKVLHSIRYEDIYLGSGSIITKDEESTGFNKNPGYRIVNLFNNNKSRNVRKIHKDDISLHPEYVHVTELIAPEVDDIGVTRNYDLITYGIDLRTLDICTPIYSERMNDYFEVVDEKPDDETLMYLDYMRGYYDINKPGDITIINKIIKPLMAAKPEKHVPDFKRLGRTKKRT